MGAGTGAGSCPAAPFRAAPSDIEHRDGCPQYAECCTEYGYCHPRVSRHSDIEHGDGCPPHYAELCTEYGYCHPRVIKRINRC